MRCGEGAVDSWRFAIAPFFVHTFDKYRYDAIKNLYSPLGIIVGTLVHWRYLGTAHQWEFGRAFFLGLISLLVIGVFASSIASVRQSRKSGL